MKHFVLFTFLVLLVAVSFAQPTYRTTQSGDYNSNSTWGGAAGKPPTNGNCNCKIIIATGHTVTFTSSITLTDANFVLDGANSRLTFAFASSADLTLLGTNSSIDLQNAQASITRGIFSGTNIITLGGQQIYNSNSTKFPASASTGTVQGPASASSARANPNFQNGTLPVKLSEFKVAGKTNGVALSWKTSLEINSSHFEIERSSDGKVWSSKGTVNAAGNVSTDQSYSFTDAAPENGTNYYRLKIVDIDAKYEYSPIKSVSFTASSLNVIAGPNPAYSYININVSAPGNQPYGLRLINRAGQVVFDQKYSASNNRIQLSVSNYADGSYFLEVTNSSGLRQINKVMIVRK